jgi:osmotically inducible protein OsmC
MAVIRRAAVVWKGNLASGSGLLDAVSSTAFEGLRVTWASRTEEADGRTSPEELLAAAHASCYSMALASDLTKAGVPPDRLSVTAEITADRVDGKLTVLSSRLEVHGSVPGIDRDHFQAIAGQAKDGCPISRALAGNVALSVEATLDR